MPIPLIVWGAVAAGAGIVAYVNRKKIAAFFESDEGKKLLKDMSDALKGMNEPYRKMIDEARAKDSDSRQEFFRAAKRRMSSDSWNMLVAYGKSLPQTEPSYISVVYDLTSVDRE